MGRTWRSGACCLHIAAKLLLTLTASPWPTLEAESRIDPGGMYDQRHRHRASVTAARLSKVCGSRKGEAYADGDLTLLIPMGH